MPINFKGLDRRPDYIEANFRENFAMYACRFNFTFESLNRLKGQVEPWGFQPRAFSFEEIFKFESYAKISGELIVAGNR